MTTQTLAVNTLWWVDFEAPVGRHQPSRHVKELIHHAVPAFQPPLNRALYHPLTWPELINGLVKVTHAMHDHVLVVDRYLGTLPALASDEFMARAIAEDWNAKLRARKFDPQDDDDVWTWGVELVKRSPRARLVTEVQWPPGLPLTKWHRTRTPSHES